jgi:hypothetical protein
MAVRLKMVAIGYWFLPAPRGEINIPPSDLVASATVVELLRYF